MSDILEKMARASHAACLKYYDGSFSPSNDPLATHRVCVAAALKELGDLLLDGTLSISNGTVSIDYDRDTQLEISGELFDALEAITGAAAMGELAAEAQKLGLE